MIPELDQLNGSNQTELEKNGEHFEFKAPVTEAVSIGCLLYTSPSPRD